MPYLKTSDLKNSGVGGVIFWRTSQGLPLCTNPWMEGAGIVLKKLLAATNHACSLTPSGFVGEVNMKSCTASMLAIFIPALGGGQ